ncbi:50S ribosomal protein L25/general stress protein Ctc [Candidatus Macondimonas diazotrophica]|jgi:large subunit ribosomal protein L25|uniref:Large ribosomal subunit protein bL25 n=1 Tax=Candidatus Macondimonas diazotrophica TaxID=2305248 RepID=A0A4Z0F7N6_9GAMM|nr:50S ribosomal protein L25/general stress protein Ctc [Candidatus Macondimonas diazotrophica]NCU01974.1 50S ribosomal protein L25/general stress protein Ctc [Candidatus Macondimonas diazotrophica]TFZ81547.1 50S ribosomal protein L25/general stress protein Ctc [Candidatus Macondimonas diazotrophica]HBG29842.1 50S ribosomal protein L25 [Gammaproteobacteria bacterium]HBG50626.1 50S ribosomal protein L25 [Gammaproteobacteria bacterium]
MSVETFKVTAASRADAGKGASRRLRRQGDVPGIVYGGDKPPMAITLSNNEMVKHLQHEAFYSHVLELELDGKTESVILKALQRHVYRAGIILHVDFQRVVAGQELHVHVPLHFVGDERSIGAKRGGIVSHLLNEVEVICLPKDLPEFIEVDVSGLDIGEGLHLSDLKLPTGVRLASLSHGESGDLAVVTIVPPKVEPAEASEAPEEG